MAQNTSNVVAIELLAAAQGIEFHRPLRSSEILESLLAQLRTEVPSYDSDRFIAPDIARAVQGVRDGRYRRALAPVLDILG